MVPESAPLVPSGAQILRGLCGGAVHLPGDAAYDESRLPWNLQADSHPAAVAYPAFTQEVSTVVRAAAAAGLRVAPQGTGHGAPPLAGHLDDAVLLRTSAMTELVVDSTRRTARVGAGVLWGDVVERAGRVSLAALHTSSPGVGVVGSSLGGGLSWYSRQHGLQCSAITAVELVMADGSVVRATDEVESDLVWAARGGGGGFGVVTALEFDLVPVSTVYAGMLAWDWALAQRVLTEWGLWSAGAPDRVTSVARLLQAPDLSWLPAGVRGRQLVVIDAVVLGDIESATRLLAPLRALRPEIDTFRECSAASVAHLQLDPLAPTAVYANSLLLDALTEGAVEALVATAGHGSGSDLLFVELRQLGGAVSRPAPRAGALERLEGSVLALCVGLDQGLGWGAVRDDANRVTQALAPWATGSAYLLMADADVEERRGWPTGAWQRLVDIRAAADPGGLFLPPRPASQQS
jgi:FAD/FMN-containing dehydrogenase